MYSRLKIEIVGNNPSYFLKELINNKINYYDLKIFPKKLILIIDYDSLKKLVGIKTTYKINIIKRYGFNKIVFYSKKFNYLIIFFILGIFLNIVLSNIIFNIEVVNPNKEIRKSVLSDLNKLGIKKYHFKVSYKKKELIKKKIKSINKSIDWIEIDQYGTKYIVRVEEKKFNKKNNICKPRNIIAKKNALILDIDAVEGEVKQDINNYVERDEVLISGFIYNKDKVVNKRCARGTVYGEVWYLVNLEIPKYKKVIKKTNKYNYSIELLLFDKKYYFPKKNQIYKKNTYNIIESNIIPINFSINKYQKIKTSYQKLNSFEQDKKILKTTVKEIKKRLKSNDKILKKKILKKNEKNSKIEVDVFVSVKENIVSYKDISNIDISEMNKKEE